MFCSIVIFIYGKNNKKGMAERVTVSVKIDPDLWKDVQHRCIDENKEYSQYVEDALKEALKKKK